MANNTHHKRNQETTEMYLETILLLEREKDGVHAVDIAKNLGFSKPTVSEYLKRLHHQGLLSVNTDSHVQLTEEGRRRAEGVYERHTVLSQLFEQLGVTPEVAVEDACRIEHFISDETFGALRNLALERGAIGAESNR